MKHDLGGKLLPTHISGTGAAPGYVLTYVRGKGWTAQAPAPSGLAYVNTTAPTSPATGQLWYDTDATC